MGLLMMDRLRSERGARYSGLRAAKRAARSRRLRFLIVYRVSMDLHGTIIIALEMYLVRPIRTTGNCVPDARVLEIIKGREHLDG